MASVEQSATRTLMSNAKDAGQRIKTAREAHRMTATELSRLSDVSRVTISAIEEGRALPRLETVESLAHALAVPPSWMAFGERYCAFLQAPNFDEPELAAKLDAIANSVGGFIDQKFLYIEPAGAAAWMKLESVREFPVLRQVADFVAKQSGGQGILELVSLGSGTARVELQFLNYLKERFLIKVVLVDISHALLRKGYDNILNGLGMCLHSVIAIQGNMEELNCYHQSIRFGLPANRRVVTMFGYTFSNLTNELQFVREALLGFEEGDYVLLEIALHDLPLPLDEKVIRQSDPMLRGSFFEEFDPRAVDVYSGPLLRNRRRVREIKMIRDVQVPSVIPNSYSVGPVISTIDCEGKKVDFRVAKANRYHLESLIAAVEREGYKMLQVWRYGERIPCAVVLFEVMGRR